MNNHTVTDTDIQPSHILVLEKLLNENELNDSDLIEDIQSDVFYECMKYGHVIDIKVPTQHDDMIGNVYVKFDNIISASNTRINLLKRSFDGKSLNVKYVNNNDQRIEELFHT